MKKQVIRILANILAVYLGTFLFPDLVISSPEAFILAGVWLWVVNLFIRPIFILLTIPLHLLTLGLFTLVINTWMVLLVGRILEGFWLGGFWTAFGLSVLVWVVNDLLGRLLKVKG